MDIFLERNGTPVRIFDMVQLVGVGDFGLYGGLRGLGLNVTGVRWGCTVGGQLRRA